MLQLRLFLLRSGIYKIARPFTGLLSKMVWFIRFADWVRDNRNIPYNDYPTKPDYNKRYGLFTWLLEEYHGATAGTTDALGRDTVFNTAATTPITYLEFGVADGETFGWWLKKITHPAARFYGFDTFQGLPEDWGVHKKGAFSNEGKIPVFDDDRCRLYKGLFQDTLQPFLKDFKNFATGQPKLILLDADLYSSTLFVLTTLAPLLQNGDILVFDEFNSPRHEFRAFKDFTQAYPHIRLKPIAAANNYTFIAFQIIIPHPHQE
jgi:O-methyltransferase